MSLPVVTFYCTQCDFQSGDARTWGTREYQLPNGACIPLNRTLGWCNDCANLAPIEELSEEPWLADIQRAEAEVSTAGKKPPNGRWKILRFIFRGTYRDLVEDWFMKQCRLDDAKDGLNLIRSLRREPKCLTCGSTQVQTKLITNQEPWQEREKPKRTGFLHPDCGGEIWMLEDGLRIGLRPSAKRYSTDGVLVETEDIGGYTLPRREYYINRDIQNAKARQKAVPAILLSAL